MSETTALGAAMAAGNAKGIEVWNLNTIEEVPSDQFFPTISDDGIFLLSYLMSFKEINQYYYSINIFSIM